MQFNYGFEGFNNYKPNVLKEGMCTFTILEIVNTNRDGTQLVAKSSGLPMIKITFEVTDANGQTTKIYEYITSKAAWKIKTLLEAINKPDLYNSSGQLNLTELLGQTGACIVKTDAIYDPEKPRSVIQKFVKKQDEPNAKPTTFNASDFDDSDLPF